jgi:hypothetical protein
MSLPATIAIFPAPPIRGVSRGFAYTRDAAPPKPAGTEKPKPFIVHVEADLFKGNELLSRGAKSLYITMASRADGSTGFLGINGHPFNWQYICSQAGIGRSTWHKYRRELVAAGLLWEQRKHRPHWDHKIKDYRVGWAETHYFVRRSADTEKTIEKPSISIGATFHTVYKVTPLNTQIPKSLRPGAVAGVADSECLLEPEQPESSTLETPKIDDDREKSSLQVKPPDPETEGRDRAVSEWMKANDLSDPVYAAAAIVHINSRRENHHPHSPRNYWAKCLASLTPEDLDDIQKQANLRWDLRRGDPSLCRHGEPPRDCAFCPAREEGAG